MMSLSRRLFVAVAALVPVAAYGKPQRFQTAGDNGQKSPSGPLAEFLGDIKDWIDKLVAKIKGFNGVSADQKVKLDSFQKAADDFYDVFADIEKIWG